ncbi:hypothetical protein Csa_005089 [Cucumis sativus]|uniref:Uncharacterized protein n=1 Tax=Cucumis sativus TaxID=3659 RepID=A0A0A0K7P1_CUCSA|nr:hypothetical protein Csa_005089 [Cucumis sativus]
MVQRVKHAPMRYDYVDLVAYAFTCETDSIEAKPFTFEEKIVSDSKKQQKDSMEAELFSLQKNQTWSLISKPSIQELNQQSGLTKSN